VASWCPHFYSIDASSKADITPKPEYLLLSIQVSGPRLQEARLVEEISLLRWLEAIFSYTIGVYTWRTVFLAPYSGRMMR